MSKAKNKESDKSRVASVKIEFEYEEGVFATDE